MTLQLSLPSASGASEQRGVYLSPQTLTKGMAILYLTAIRTYVYEQVDMSSNEICIHSSSNPCYKPWTFQIVNIGQHCDFKILVNVPFYNRTYLININFTQ